VWHKRIVGREGFWRKSRSGLKRPETEVEESRLEAGRVGGMLLTFRLFFAYDVRRLSPNLDAGGFAYDNWTIDVAGI
jgi:hypothetical protein